MTALPEIAPAFVAMAHQIVWCTVATVDGRGRPRSRILHPIWQWDGTVLIGWIATSPTPVKSAHLAKTPFASLNYWAPNHDTCAAECHAELTQDDDIRKMVWELFLNEPEPVGYDPRIVPAWTSPTADTFAAIKLTPWRLRVFPGTLLRGQGGELLSWNGN